MERNVAWMGDRRNRDEREGGFDGKEEELGFQGLGMDAPMVIRGMDEEVEGVPVTSSRVGDCQERTWDESEVSEVP